MSAAASSPPLAVAATRAATIWSHDGVDIDVGGGIQEAEAKAAVSELPILQPVVALADLGKNRSTLFIRVASEEVILEVPGPIDLGTAALRLWLWLPTETTLSLPQETALQRKRNISSRIWGSFEEKVPWSVVAAILEVEGLGTESAAALRWPYAQRA
jgi:hypothetical protein